MNNPIPLIKALAKPDAAMVESAVTDWLDDHPEATTTVEDGSITKAKLATALQTTIDAIPAVDATLATAGAAADAKKTGDEVSNLKSTVDALKDATVNIEEGRVTEDIISGITWTTGYYIAPDGTVLENEGLKYSSKIPVAEGDVIAIEPNTSAFRFVCAYNGSTAVSASGTQNVNSYTVPSGVNGVVLSCYIDPSYAPTAINRTYEGAIYKNLSVPLDGENKVTPQNIEGMTFTKTYGQHLGDNVFSTSMLFEEGKYVIAANGEATSGANASYNSYCVPVDGESTYYLSDEARFVCLATGNAEGSTAVGTTLNSVSEVDTTGATYMFLSFDLNVITPANVTVKKMVSGYTYSDFNAPYWMRPEYKTPCKKITGNIAAGGRLYDASNREEPRKNDRIVFTGNFSEFTSLTIGNRYAQSYDVTYFVIDNTNISYYFLSDSTPVVKAHGLTIANNIQVIIEQTEEATAKVTLISNGEMYQAEFAYTRSAGAPVAESEKAMTNCVLSWICTDIHLPIWIFGDSYLSYSADRWTYYLHQHGYDRNALLSGWAGESSINNCVAFENYLNYGRPRFACLFSGMNDGSDSESAPASNWVTYRDRFIGDCEAAHVTPIFATIPTVPTVNNEKKNAWIKASGYRYVDFAKAVGAQSDGTWFSGMLSQDGVHPTAAGAKALFAQFMADFPEIMLNATWGATPIET